MVRVRRFGPRSVGATTPSRGTMGRGDSARSTNGTCIFYQDRNNYVVFKLTGRAQGFAGNRWSVLLYRSATNRFSVRIKDSKGDILATVTSSSGAAACATAVNANATLGAVVKMSVYGTIDNDTDFSADLDDYCKFTGGS